MKRIAALVVLGFLMYGCSSNNSSQSQSKEQSPDGAMSVSSNNASQQKNATVAKEIQLAKQKLFKAGTEYLNRSRIEEAVKVFSQAIQLDPRDSQGYFLLAQMYMHLKKYDNAVQVLDRYIAVDSQNGQAYYMKGIASGLSGNQQEALSAAQRSIIVFQTRKDDANLKRALILFQSLSASAQGDTAQDLAKIADQQTDHLKDAISANIPMDSTTNDMTQRQ